MTARTKQIIAAALVAVSSVGLIAVAQPAPPDQHAVDAPQGVEAKSITGSVIGMNLSPDGEANAVLVKTGDGPVTQLDFPPHMAAEIGKIVKVGGTITAQARPLPPRPPRPDAGGPRGPRQPGGPDGGPGGPDNGPGGPNGGPGGPDADRPAPPPPPPADHPVMELVSLTPDGGQALAINKPGDGPSQHVDGKVARLNYTREGQVDGAVLEDGTLIHTGPKGAQDLKLAVGQSLSVDGIKPPRAGENKVLQATKVNDTAIERPRRPAPGEGPRGEGRGDRQSPKGPPAP